MMQTIGADLAGRRWILPDSFGCIRCSCLLVRSPQVSGPAVLAAEGPALFPALKRPLSIIHAIQSIGLLRPVRLRARQAGPFIGGMHGQGRLVQRWPTRSESHRRRLAGPSERSHEKASGCNWIRRNRRPHARFPGIRSARHGGVSAAFAIRRTAIPPSAPAGSSAAPPASSLLPYAARRSGREPARSASPGRRTS